jgi:hypothetical protein
MSYSAPNPENNASDLPMTRQQQWQSIVDKSQQLQHLARQKAWQSLLALQEEREEELERFFRQKDIPAEMAARIAEDVKAILAADKQIRHDVLTHQSALMQESTHLKKLQQRSRSYQAMGKLDSF